MAILGRFWSSDRGLSILLLVLMLVIFVIHPMEDLGVAGSILISLFFSLLLISGAGAAAKSPLARIFVATLVVLGLVVHWLRFWRGGHALVMLDAFLSVLFCAVLAVVVLAQVFREGPITAQRIQGAIAVYLLLGLAWAFAYAFVDLRWPGAFTPAATTVTTGNGDASSRFVYFSFVTLTTVGYGDIAAVHPVARSLATLEALIGQLFPAILLARLVSMEVYYRQVGKAKE